MASDQFGGLQAGNVPLSRWCPDLDKPEYRFWNRMQIPILALSLFGGLAFGSGDCIISGPRNYRMHSRWLDLSRIYSTDSSLTQPGVPKGERR